MTGQKKKTTDSNDKKNDNPNDKINIFMYPSVWLQVPCKYIAFLALAWIFDLRFGRFGRAGNLLFVSTRKK